MQYINDGLKLTPEVIEAIDSAKERLDAAAAVVANTYLGNCHVWLTAIEVVGGFATTVFHAVSDGINFKVTVSCFPNEGVDIFFSEENGGTLSSERIHKPAVPEKKIRVPRHIPDVKDFIHSVIENRRKVVEAELSEDEMKAIKRRVPPGSYC